MGSSFVGSGWFCSSFFTEFFIIALKSKQPEAKLMTEDHTDHLQG